MVTFYKIVLHAMVILVFESEGSTSDCWWDIAITVNVVPGPFLLEDGASGRDQKWLDTCDHVIAVAVVSLSVEIASLSGYPIKKLLYFNLFLLNCSFFYLEKKKKQSCENFVVSLIWRLDVVFLMMMLSNFQLTVCQRKEWLRMFLKST